MNHVRFPKRLGGCGVEAASGRPVELEAGGRTHVQQAEDGLLVVQAEAVRFRVAARDREDAAFYDGTGQGPESVQEPGEDLHPQTER